MKRIQALAVLATVTGGLVGWSPLAQAEPVYRYCMIPGGPNLFQNCLFSTLQQCQVAASAGVGFCQENSLYTAARNAPPAVTPVTRSRQN